MEQVKHLTYDIIEDLPNLSVDLSYTDGKFKGLKYMGFLIINIIDDKYIKYHCGELDDILNTNDLNVVQNFLPIKRNLYIENYYRIDFENYIYLFQYIKEDDKRLMMGNLLKKDFETRLNLAELYQQAIMRKLVYAG